ncbi:S26 family signal peptidase [Haloarchaeobius iranensis]|uniref:Signal peptidase, endoplasmic reticulum-type n=1 Tax=Haloarchaeobius iranensis TaxID=996166 RepID=A0A1G9SEY3_9EURY|nr:S26 family signal peptidase [Haloarchaeobius iranensis]SDM34038.1 signal peptidase, endoplasmic reticulum-type [Haloarchaeobius iranensis]
MTGPGTDDESDDPSEEGETPRHDTDRARPGTDDDDRSASTDDTQVSDDPTTGHDGGTDPHGSGRDSPERSAPTEPSDSETDAMGPVEATPGGQDDGTADDGTADDGTHGLEPERSGATTAAPGGPAPDDSAPEPDGPAPEPDGPPIPGNDQRDEQFDGPVDWFLHTDDSFVMTVRDIGSSLLTVAVLGLVLFAVSGIWPPLVAVESGSMEPHMHKNDLVFIVEEGRFTGDAAQSGTGVVTHRAAQQNDGYWSFGNYGNVIVYQPNDNPRRVPIIHRARFWVDAGENWVDSEAEGGTGKANPQYLSRSESADQDFDCAEITACRPNHSGFITKGDANDVYDQIGGQSNVVRPDWVRGKAKVRVPLLGWIRLQFAQLATTFGGTGPTALGMLRLQLGVVFAGAGTVVARRRGVL